MGHSRDVVTDWVRAGRLHRLHRGVYALGHLSLTWNSHCLAAVLASAPAFASHASAAWLWGLLRRAPSTIDVTATTRRHQKKTIRVHFACLTARDLAELEGIPVASLARTQLDLAATLPSSRLERMLQRSEELGLFDLGAVDELLERTHGHPGAKPLRACLADYRPDPAFTRSRLEKRFLALARKAGLPAPAMNFNVAGFELDAYWEAERFVVELDVYETHGTRLAFEGDRLRQEDLKLMGIEMIRITGPRLDRAPDAVMARVASLLAQRRRQLGMPEKQETNGGG